MLDAPRGIVSAQTTVNKFGENPLIALGARSDVWDGVANYSYPANVDMTHISENFDVAADRGANVEIQGLDTSWALVTQHKALNATNSATLVELDTPLRRTFRLKVLANIVAGANIDIHNAGGGITYATAQAGNNQTLMALYTVPAGKTAYLTCYYVGVVAGTNQDPKSTEFKLWAADRANGYEFQLKHMRAIQAGQTGITHCFKPYFKATEKTDIKITAQPEDKAAKVHAGFDLILVDN